MDNEGKTATKSTEEKLALARELGTIVQNRYCGRRHGESSAGYANYLWS